MVASFFSLRLISHGDAEDLLRRRDAVENLRDAGHAESQHALLDRGGLELRGRRALEDHLLQAVGEAHDLVERDAALVAGAVARAAAEALHQAALRDVDL